MSIEAYIIVIQTALLVGLVPAFIAAAKGRPFLTWWLYGAGAVFLALPHALLVRRPDTDSPMRDRTRSDGGWQDCPSCNERVPAHAVACRYCGFSFEDLTAPVGDETDDGDMMANSHAGRGRPDFAAAADRGDGISAGTREGHRVYASHRVELPWNEADFGRVREQLRAQHGPSADQHAALRSDGDGWLTGGRAGVIAIATLMIVGMAYLGSTVLVPDRVRMIGAIIELPPSMQSESQSKDFVASEVGRDLNTALPGMQKMGRPHAFMTLPESGDGDTRNPAVSTEDSPSVEPPIRAPMEPSARAIMTLPETIHPMARPEVAPPAVPSASSQSASKPVATVSGEDGASGSGRSRVGSTTVRASAARPDVTTGSLQMQEETVTAVGELVLWLQRELATLGFYAGEINGRAGPQTRDAILAYQRARQLTPTGRINEALIVSLRRSTSESVPAGGPR